MASKNSTNEVISFLKKFLVLAILIFIFVIIYFIAIYPVAKKAITSRLAPFAQETNDVGYGGGMGEVMDMVYSEKIISPQAMPMHSSVGNEEQKVIKTASLEAQVTDINNTISQITQIANTTKGFVQYSNVYEDNIGKRYGNITILVPQDKLAETILNIKNLVIKVINESSNNNDATEQYINIETQVNSLKAIEKQYLSLLEKAKTVDEIINVQDRLNSTQRELSSYEKQLEYLSNQVSYSSISVLLNEQGKLNIPANKFDLNETFRGGIKTLITILQNFLVFAIVLFFVLIGLIPYIILVLAITWIIRKIIKKQNKK